MRDDGFGGGDSRRGNDRRNGDLIEDEHRNDDSGSGSRRCGG